MNMFDIMLWLGGAAITLMSVVFLDLFFPRNLTFRRCGGWYLHWPAAELFQRFDVMREFHVECPLFKYHWFALDGQIVPLARLRAVDRRFAVSGDRNWIWPGVPT